MRTPYFILAAAVAIALGLYLRPSEVSAQTAAAAPAGPPPASVEVTAALNETIAPSQWVPGTVISRADARIGSELPGRLKWVAEVGSVVEAGAELARLDQAALLIERRQDRADVARLKAQHGHAVRQVERLESMGARSAVAVSQLDETRTQRDVLAQELARAEADLADSERRLEASVIRAPFGGTVVERMASAGEVANSGMPLLRLVDTRTLEVQARAPAQVALALSSGSPVALKVGGEEVQMALRTVVPVGDSGSRQLELRVALDDGRWPVGTAVQVALPAAEAHPGIAVPRDALVLRGEQTFVFRVNAEGKAERLEVRTGRAQGDHVEISGGTVQAGDNVVIRGGERLRDGQAVTVVQRAG